MDQKRPRSASRFRPHAQVFLRTPPHLIPRVRRPPSRLPRQSHRELPSHSSPLLPCSPVPHGLQLLCLRRVGCQPHVGSPHREGSPSDGGPRRRTPLSDPPPSKGGGGAESTVQRRPHGGAGGRHLAQRKGCPPRRTDGPTSQEAAVAIGGMPSWGLQSAAMTERSAAAPHGKVLQGILNFGQDLLSNVTISWH